MAKIWSTAINTKSCKILCKADFLLYIAKTDWEKKSSTSQKLMCLHNPNVSYQNDASQAVNLWFSAL